MSNRPNKRCKLELDNMMNDISLNDMDKVKDIDKIFNNMCLDKDNDKDKEKENNKMKMKMRVMEKIARLEMRVNELEKVIEEMGILRDRNIELSKIIEDMGDKRNYDEFYIS